MKAPNMKLTSTLVALLVAVPYIAHAEGDSPWLPIPGQVSLSFSHTEQSGNDAYIGDERLSLYTITGGAASRFERATTALRLGYGISDALAFDATVGWGHVKAGDADEDEGMIDSVLGLNWRVIDELEDPSLFTLTLRAAAIIKGDYEGGRLAGLGNGANGIELAAITGKQLSPNWSVSAEIGFQDRDHDVPNAVFVELGTSYRFAPAWVASLGYAAKRYGGTLDIGGPGFTPDRFQEVREERDVVKLGLGWAFAGNQALGLNASQLVNGRNTTRDDYAVSLSYTYGF